MSVNLQKLLLSFCDHINLKITAVKMEIIDLCDEPLHEPDKAIVMTGSMKKICLGLSLVGGAMVKKYVYDYQDR